MPGNPLPQPSHQRIAPVTSNSHIARLQHSPLADPSPRLQILGAAAPKIGNAGTRMPIPLPWLFVHIIILYFSVTSVTNHLARWLRTRHSDMDTFADDFIFYVLFVGLNQVLIAMAVALIFVPILARATKRGYGNLLGQFALLNIFLLVWGAMGNSLWLYLTNNRLSVADDCPVWAPFVPFGQWVLDNATGWSGGWQLHGGTTIEQLQWIWAAIAFPVWAISFLSVYISRAIIARLVPRAHAPTAT